MPSDQFKDITGENLGSETGSLVEQNRHEKAVKGDDPAVGKGTVDLCT
jgi:hypothetical protein